MAESNGSAVRILPEGRSAKLGSEGYLFGHAGAVGRVGSNFHVLTTGAVVTEGFGRKIGVRPAIGTIQCDNRSIAFERLRAASVCPETRAFYRVG